MTLKYYSKNSDSRHSAISFVGIIPARYASTRFLGKPLVDIGGKTMIQRVYEQVSKVLADVYVATDSQLISDAVEAFGGKVVMTSDQHQSGTDRVYEAYQKIGKTFDVIVNVQGDEPFIQPEQIESLQHCFQDSKTEIATLAKTITKEQGFDFLFDANNVKLIFDKQNYAMYFSRSIIPYVRGKHHQTWMDEHTYYKHIGVYAYRADVLSQIAGMKQTDLEIAESLEQLRWLENGLRIKIGITDVESVGIDTPEDLERVKKMFL